MLWEISTRKNSMNNVDVIVVGAGISGLSAAYNLYKNNISTIVLEASQRVGGRMTTDMIGDHPFDRGAQFLSSSYTNILSLINEIDLGSQLLTLPEQGGIIHHQKIVKLKQSKPYQAFTKGLFPWKDLPRITKNLLTYRNSFSQLSLSDYSAWTDFDTENASDWSNRLFGNNYTEYFIEPILEGFYFQTPEDTSKSLALVLGAFTWRKAKTLTLKNGLGSLPEALAKKLSVKLDVRVQKIIPTDTHVRIITNRDEFRASYVILATPATETIRLYDSANPIERTLLKTKYSSTINAALITNHQWRHLPQLNNLYGILIPRRERNSISAIAIEYCKYKSNSEQEHLNIMLAGRQAQKHWSDTEQQLLQNILPEVGKYFPNISDHLLETKIIRWAEAIPYSAVGRSKNILEYRKNTVMDRRVLLSGDYMGMPFTEGAAESGIWISNKLLEMISDKIIPNDN